MPLYITVSRGPRADEAVPILASSDRNVVGAVLQSLARLDESGFENDSDAVARRLLDDEDLNGTGVPGRSPLE